MNKEFVGANCVRPNSLNRNVGVGVLDDPREMKKTIVGTRISRPHHNSNGITLVALVITIVIMLILAGISLAVAFGENGLVTRGKNAKAEARGEIVYNEVIKWKENIELVQGAGGEKDKEFEDFLEEILDELEEKEYITQKEREEIKPPEYKIKIGKREIDFKFETLEEPDNSEIVIVAGDIEFTQTPNTLTNESIIVTISTNKQEYTLEYSKDNIEWSTYTNGVEYLQNGTIYARLKRRNKASNVLTEEITNIDKLPPVISSSTSTTNSVTFTGTDNNGIIGYNVTTSNTPPSGWTTVTSTKTLTQTVNDLVENTPYYIWVKDVVGNVNTVKSIVTEEMPTIDGLEGGNITFSYSPSTWTNQNVTASISTSITGFILQYSKTGTSGWTNYTNGVQYTANGTIYARLTDGTNVTNTATGNITNIDRLQPNTFTISPAATTNSITCPVPTITDADATSTNGSSGISKIEYKLNSGGTYSTSTRSWSGLISGSTHTVYVRATDSAGNTREVTKGVTVGTVPGGTITLIPSTTAWTNQNVVVTITTSVSGYTLQYSLNGTSWTTISNGAKYTFTSNGTIWARLYDGVNGSSNTTRNITNIEKTNPVVGTITPAETGATFSATDNLSGIVAYGYNQSSTAQPSWTTISATMSLTNRSITGLASSTTYYIWVKDAAGNFSNKAFTTLTHVHSYVWSQPPTNNRDDCAVAACACGATTSQPHEWASLAFRHCNACGSVQGGVGGIPAGTSPVSYCTRCSGFNCGFCSYYNSPYRMGL